MKTQEEIEQLVDEIYGEYSGYHKASFVNGYTQYQEDMAEKKYTEEDMKKAFDSGYDIRSSYGDRDDNITAEQYINSLNKQD